MAPASAPLIVAYVYGGWHRALWRPHVDEWALLDNWKPYFQGHAPAYRPLSGPYDDTLLVTARRQVRSAATHGISGFSYFLYADEHGLVMDLPARQALRAAGETGFGIGLTWCLRLPHYDLPIPASFTLYRTRGNLTTMGASRPVHVPTGSVLPLFGGALDDPTAARALLRLGGPRQYCIN